MFRGLFRSRSNAVRPGPTTDALRTPRFRAQHGQPSQRPERREPRLVPPGEAFTPTQPKAGRRRLVGRQEELGRILQALLEERAHVVLYSERGRGKTSLANLVTQHLRAAGVTVARCTCEAGTDFNSLMRGLMRVIPSSLLLAPISGRAAMGDLAREAELDDGEGCEAALPNDLISPRDVADVPRRLACHDLVCVVDEFDRVMDGATRTKLADTIKQISDRDVNLRFLVVGVSENLDEILGQHPSIQRVVAGLHLPLLSDHDVAQLIAMGGRETGLVFSPAMLARIIHLARGMPYMAQLLGLRLAQAAAERGDNVVSDSDFMVAIDRLIAAARPQTEASYAALTDFGRDESMVETMRVLAAAPQDCWGRIQVLPPPAGSESAGPFVDGRSVAWRCWDRLLAEGALRPFHAGSGLFVFTERALMHHTLVLAARDGAMSYMAEETDQVPEARALQHARSDGRS